MALSFVFICNPIDTTCEECLSHDQEVYAAGDPDMPQLPIHPNCRCTLEPVMTGNDDEGGQGMTLEELERIADQDL